MSRELLNLTRAVLVAAVLAAPTCVWADDAKPLTLAEAKRLAVERSPLMRAADYGVEALKQQYEEAWWAWFPTLKLRTLATILPPQGEPDPEVGFDLSGWNLWSRTDLEIFMPIYTFGKLSALRRMAAAGVDAGNSARHIARGELEFQVSKAWFGLALAGELEALIADAERSLEKSRDKLLKMEEDDDDEFDQADLFRLRIHEARMRKVVLGNAQLRELSKTALRVAIVVPRGGSLNLPDEMSLAPVEAKIEPIEFYIAAAAKQRPELLTERHTIDVRRADVDRRWAEFWPDIFLGANVTIAASTVPKGKTEENVFTGASFNTLGGGAAFGIQLTLDYPQKMARYRRAQAELGRAEAEFETNSAKLRVELEEVWRDAKSKHEQLELQRRAMKAAKSLRTLKALEYTAGVDVATTFEDVLNASVTYLTQRSEWLQAIYGFNLSIARLSRVVGTDITKVSP